jgi:hypothetical protein
MSGAPHSTSQQRLTHGVTVVVGDADGDRAGELDTAGDMAGVTEGDTDGTVRAKNMHTAGENVDD